MKRPDRAFVLAAGLGTRMRPLSDEKPKPMMPLWGRPLLLRVLETLRGWGVREVLVNLHHRAGEVLAFAASHPVPGLRLSLSFEPQLLGTGGALVRGAWFLGDAPFWLVNADIAFELNPDPLLRALRAPRDLAALWLHPERGPRTVETARGRVTCFTSDRPGAPGTATFCGLHLVRPEILSYLPDRGPASIITAYEHAMADGRRIAAVTVPGAWWSDLGTPERYLAAHAECAPPPAADAFVSLAPGVRLSPRARLSRAVVWDGARIEAGARVTDAIVGRAVTVRGPAQHVVVRAEAVLDNEEQRVLARLGVRTGGASAMLFPPRGSARSFIRVQDARRRVLLIRYSAERPENLRYAPHARFLKRAGLPVPAVLHHDARRGLLVTEDLGDTSLADAVRGRSRASIRARYRRVLDAVIRWHDHGTRRARRDRLALEPAFGPALYRRERALFRDGFLRGRSGLAPGACRPLLRDLERVAECLRGAAPVLLHRDLQSSNVLLVRGRPFFIDFQGMRYGPAAYDVASLLCDPYVSLPAALQEELLAYYAKQAPNGQETLRLFAAAAVQRLAQALGAFGRLAAVPGAKRFEAHIPPALEMLRRVLRRRPGEWPALERWLKGR